MLKKLMIWREDDDDSGSGLPQIPETPPLPVIPETPPLPIIPETPPTS